MHPLRLSFVALAVLAASCGGGGDNASFGSGGSAGGKDATTICGTLDGFVSSDAGAAGKVGGYSFAAFDADSVLLACAGGDQQIGAIRPIASASKLPSAAAIMTLVDSNQLNLDLPVLVYLLRAGIVWPLDKALITTRMLLAHTSGLPGLAPTDTQPACVDDETGFTMKDCVTQIAAAPLVATPGQVFNYGGADYQVAGYIATIISGQSWQDFFNAAIATPLGMSTFSYGNPATVTNPRVAGGAVSSAADYVKFLQMLINNGQAGGNAILSASSVTELETDQIAGKTKQYTPVDATLYPGYTFGFFISADPVHPGSAGPELLDPGLFGTTPWIDLDKKYGAVLIITKNTPTGLAMMNTVRPLIYAALPPS